MKALGSLYKIRMPVMASIHPGANPPRRAFCSESDNPSRKDKIKAKLQTLNPSLLVVDDYMETNQGNAVGIQIVSPEFSGKTIIQQHRMVQGLIREEIETIHSINISSMTPDQYAAK